MPVRRAPAVLRERLGQNATLGLVELLDTEEVKWSEKVLSVAADRFERRLTEGLASLRVDFETKFASLRVEIIKWSFLFWLGQVAVIVSVLAFMLGDR